jgi:hypothetical protein
MWWLVGTLLIIFLFMKIAVGLMTYDCLFSAALLAGFFLSFHLIALLA